MDLLKRVDKACLKSKIDKLVEESLRARDRDINMKREKYIEALIFVLYTVELTMVLIF